MSSFLNLSDPETTLLDSSITAEVTAFAEKQNNELMHLNETFEQLKKQKSAMEQK
jgi:hypothetical protein